MESETAAAPRLGSGRPDALAKLRSLATSTWALGALVFLLTWGGGNGAVFTPNIDVSFHAGLNMAATQGLQFGPDVLVTYGPLGFLKSYLVFYEWPARLAVLYGLALHLALSLSLVWALRRNFGAIVAVAVGLVAAALMRGDLSAIVVRDDAGVVVLALIWTIAVLAPGAPAWARPLVLYGGGAFAALEILAKLSSGLVVLALVALAAVAIEGGRRRNLATAAVTFAASLAALWFASGQGLDDVGSFLSGTWQVASGYSSGARAEFGFEDRGYDYVLAPIILAGVVVLAWISSRRAANLPRLAIFTALAVVSFTAYKAGFVAHEGWHMATFYATMLGAYIAFPLPEGTAVRIGALAATVALAATALIAVSFPGYPLSDPFENVGGAAETVVSVVDPGGLEGEIEDNRAALKDQFGLDESSLAQLEGQGVHVDPTETAAAWAYDLDWDPLPVFQPYVAWTSELDRKNAEALASPRGPARILRQQIDVLGRYAGFESPAAMVAMLCNFRALRTTETWQVLGRTPDRCGEPRKIASAEGAYGEPIPVPAGPKGSAVVARVDGVQVSGLERLRTALARARARTVVFGGGPQGGPDAREWALVERTAADGLLLRAPPGADFPAPFALAPEPDTITFLLDGEGSEQSIHVDYFAIPVRAASER